MTDDLQRLAAILDVIAKRPQPLRHDAELQVAMRVCVEQGLDRLPLPAGGQTLQRWQALASVAGHDLALAKLYESHTDAIAILHELDSEHLLTDGLWAVWAADPPYARLNVGLDAEGVARLQGRKAWCSGAAQIDSALITAWDEQNQPRLVAVNLHQRQVAISDQGWQAVGMATTASVEVQFDQAQATLVGGCDSYLSRPGFWHGGAGIAACWYGAAAALGQALKAHCAKRTEDPHAQAHLGAVDATLCSAAGALRDGAQWIDQHPRQDAQWVVRRVRAQVEQAADEVLQRVGRALGATPYCRDPHFARLAADLPVFMRQSHAERDLAELGRQVASADHLTWQL
ncbi:MAG: acyl-CoA dehydrogenase [Pseudomonas sp.]|nr:acyl-CoA dehydrogenase [Pseudomonas sp.]MBQ0777395.1 acyl-CoA dehydrogenase [Pseudomonas sp.]